MNAPFLLVWQLLRVDDQHCGTGHGAGNWSAASPTSPTTPEGPVRVRAQAHAGRAAESRARQEGPDLRGHQPDPARGHGQVAAEVADQLTFPLVSGYVLDNASVVRVGSRAAELVLTPGGADDGADVMIWSLPAIYIGAELTEMADCGRGTMIGDSNLPVESLQLRAPGAQTPPARASPRPTTPRRPARAPGTRENGSEPGSLKWQIRSRTGRAER